MPESSGSRRTMVTRVVVILSVLLFFQIAASYGISVGERPLATPRLRLIPATIGGWTLGGEEALEPDVANQLKPDDYVMRSYQDGNRASSVSLFVAYFKSLQNDYGPHSPRACLPGSGWLTHSWEIVTLPVPGKAERIPVNKYVLEKDTQKILVVYWYQNNRRVWAEDFGMKLHLLPDMLRYRRSDVSLVRIITPLGSDGSLKGPYERASQFTYGLFPSLVERFNTTE